MGGISYRTPGTKLWWSNVAQWCATAHQIDRRRSSAARHRALEAHASCLPLDLITEETDLNALEEAVSLLKYGPPSLRRPQRGHRTNAPHTPIIMALQNRKRALERDADSIPAGANWRAAHGAH